MQISGTLQAGITVIPDSTMRTTGALDDKRLSDLSMCASMYPGGDAALDTDDLTGTATDADAGKESQRPGTQGSQHNNSLAFNPLFNEAESGQVASDNGETLKMGPDGTVHIRRSMKSILHFDTQVRLIYRLSICVCALLSGVSIVIRSLHAKM